MAWLSPTVLFLQYCTVLYRTMQYRTTPYRIIPHRIILYRTMPYCTALYWMQVFAVTVYSHLPSLLTAGTCRTSVPKLNPPQTHSQFYACIWSNHLSRMGSTCDIVSVQQQHIKLIRYIFCVFVCFLQLFVCTFLRALAPVAPVWCALLLSLLTHSVDIPCWHAFFTSIFSTRFFTGTFRHIFM